MKIHCFTQHLCFCDTWLDLAQHFIIFYSLKYIFGHNSFKYKYMKCRSYFNIHLHNTCMGPINDKDEQQLEMDK